MDIVYSLYKCQMFDLTDILEIIHTQSINLLLILLVVHIPSNQ